MNESLHITIRYEDAGDGWVMAQVAEIPGAISQGKTREEARANVLDALDLMLTPDEELEGESNGADSESVTLTRDQARNSEDDLPAARGGASGARQLTG